MGNFCERMPTFLRLDEWIIDGFGNVASAWERFAVADTLIYIDLPLWIYYRRRRSAWLKGCSQAQKLAGK